MPDPPPTHTPTHFQEATPSNPPSSAIPPPPPTTSAAGAAGMDSSPLPSPPPPPPPPPPLSPSIQETSPSSPTLYASLSAQQSALLTGELPDAAFLANQYLPLGSSAGGCLACTSSTNTSKTSTSTNTSTSTDGALLPSTNISTTPNPTWFWPPRACRTLWRLYTTSPSLSNPSGIPNWTSIAATLTQHYHPTFQRGGYTTHDIQTALLPTPPQPLPPTPAFSTEELRLARELWTQLDCANSEDVFAEVARRMNAAFSLFFGREQAFSAEECAWVIDQAEWEEREYFAFWNMYERKRVWVKWLTYVPSAIRRSRSQRWPREMQEEYRRPWYETVAARVERELLPLYGRRYTARQVEWCVGDWEAEFGVRDLVEPGWRAEGLVRVFGEEAFLVDGLMLGV